MRTTIIQEDLFDKLSTLSPAMKLVTLAASGLLIILIVLGLESYFQGNKLRQTTQQERVLKQSFESQFRQYTKLTYVPTPSLPPNYPDLIHKNILGIPKGLCWLAER